jgi:hypothetical protein
MSIEKINLRKLLQLFYADPRQERSLLLADISNDRRREAEDSGEGGDFYTPFWADVKAHVAGRVNIQDQMRERISRNKGRARLYPLLADSFLEMWAEKIRWRNEPFEFVPESIKAQMSVPELGTTVKIENTVGVRIWDGSYRVIYPYFSEKPALPGEGVRLGFWALQEALPDYDPDDFRIVDFHRTTYFRPVEVGMNGAEGKLFFSKV